MRGHPLVWHNAHTDWIADKERAALKIGVDIMSHAERLLTLYPEIDEWDIYNEAPVWEEFRITRYGSWNEAVDGSGDSGQCTEKLALLIQRLRPEADGLVNHFNRSSSYHTMIQTCIDRGVPIRGIGFAITYAG